MFPLHHGMHQGGSFRLRSFCTAFPFLSADPKKLPALLIASCGRDV